jgi:hypothetical protein
VDPYLPFPKAFSGNLQLGTIFLTFPSAQLTIDRSDALSIDGLI